MTLFATADEYLLASLASEIPRIEHLCLKEQCLFSSSFGYAPERGGLCRWISLAPNRSASYPFDVMRDSEED